MKIQIGRQIERLIDRQKNEQIDRKMNRQIEKLIDRERDIWEDFIPFMWIVELFNEDTWILNVYPYL